MGVCLEPLRRSAVKGTTPGRTGAEGQSGKKIDTQKVPGSNKLSIQETPCLDKSPNLLLAYLTLTLTLRPRYADVGRLFFRAFPLHSTPHRGGGGLTVGCSLRAILFFPLEERWFGVSVRGRVRVGGRSQQTGFRKGRAHGQKATDAEPAYTPVSQAHGGGGGLG